MLYNKFRYVTIKRKDATTMDVPMDQRASYFVVKINNAVPYDHKMLK